MSSDRRELRESHREGPQTEVAIKADSKAYIVVLLSNGLVDLSKFVM